VARNPKKPKSKENLKQQSMCTTVIHNTAHNNSFDSLPSYSS